MKARFLNIHHIISGDKITSLIWKLIKIFVSYKITMAIY